MSRLVLVRHGEAAAGWGDDLDPGLSDAGRRQAAAMAAAVAADLAPDVAPVLVSPLRRTRETAAPLEARWATAARVEPAVGEIVAPAGDDGLLARSAWLRTAMAGRWSDLGDEHRAWRESVLDALVGAASANAGAAVVVVTHFIAINVAVGAATADDRVVCFAPDHCSRTVLDVAGGRLALVSLGAQAVTEVR